MYWFCSSGLSPMHAWHANFATRRVLWIFEMINLRRSDEGLYGSDIFRGDIFPIDRFHTKVVDLVTTYISNLVILKSKLCLLRRVVVERDEGLVATSNELLNCYSNTWHFTVSAVWLRENGCRGSVAKVAMDLCAMKLRRLLRTPTTVW